MTDKEKTYGRVTIYTSLVAAALAIGALIWNMSDTSTKAHQAYAFVSRHSNLPTRTDYHQKAIDNIDARVCTLEQLATSVAVLNANLATFSLKLERLMDDVRAGNSRRSMNPG